MIVAQGLTRRYGQVTAVDDVSFTVEPGEVTGFLGPNGAGKSTTMRLMLGLDQGEGRTTFDGRTYAELEQPTHDDFIARHSRKEVITRADQPEELLRTLWAAGFEARRRGRTGGSPW
jgi:ABC-type multidrug transport system ATPase subunit